LAGLTKTVLESPLDGELAEHLGYDPYEPAGYHSGNSRNGTWPSPDVGQLFAHEVG
jgi:putative transposase